MKKLTRIAATVSVCSVWLFGASSIVNAGRGKSTPAPPPPVLCGCLCPDGSIMVTHAPDAESCPSVCATACNTES